MDNLTHGLLGAAIGMVRRREGGPERAAPLTETDKAVVWAAVLAAELPDVDVFFGRGSPLDSLVYHRGITHSLAAAPLLALAATGLVKLRWRRARPGTVYLWSLASLLIAHLVNDWMTGWGTRLLLPWSDARLALDWVPIVDPLYTLPLLVGVLVAWRRPHLRRRAASAALVYLLLYAVGYRGLSHAWLTAQVRAHYRGQPVQALRVSPSLFSPVAWQVTVDLGDRYEQGTASLVQPYRVDRVVAKAPEDPVVQALRRAPELKPFFDHYRFPVIEYRRTGDGYVAVLGDVRYQFRGRSLGYEVHLTPDLRIRRIVGSGW